METLESRYLLAVTLPQTISPAGGWGESIDQIAAADLGADPIDGRDLADTDEALRHLLFAPGTPQSYVDANDGASDSQQAGEQPGSSSPFTLSSRWWTTATNGGGLGQGDPTTVTWSIVPDGTSIPAIGGISGESSDPSNLVAFLGGIYGVATADSNYTDEPWFTLIESTVDRWSELTGLTYLYEPNDDGAAFTSYASSAPGVLGTRGDVRLGGHQIDGNAGVLAYNFFPNHGDMVIDTSDNFFNNLGNDSRRLRNTLAHEQGHGIGLQHVESNNAGFLMEPFLSTGFDGPQFDDILARATSLR